MIRKFVPAFVFLLVFPASGTAARVGSPECTSIRAWCQSAGGWLEARGNAIWLIAEGRADRRLMTSKSRIVDLSVTAGRRPLVAIALAASASRAVLVARFAPSPKRPGLQVLGGGVEPHRRPWRVSWGDVDGDGRDELLVGVVGRARFDPVERNRPFVYTWDGRRLVPKWLGSRLSRPFTDALLGDVDGEDPSELVAIESTRDGGLELAVYSWKGFGFERRFASSRISAPASLERARDGRILLRADGRESRVAVQEERISITPTELP